MLNKVEPPSREQSQLATGHCATPWQVPFIITAHSRVHSSIFPISPSGGAVVQLVAAPLESLIDQLSSTAPPLTSTHPADINNMTRQGSVLQIPDSTRRPCSLFIL